MHPISVSSRLPATITHVNFIYFPAYFEIKSGEPDHIIFSHATRTFWRNACPAQNISL